MFRFEWSELVSSELLDEISALGPGEEPLGPAASGALTAIFRAAGGLPVARSDWTGAHRLSVARKLLHEVVVGFLHRRAHFTHPRVGVSFRPDGERRVVAARALVDANQADASTLAALPGIGEVLATRIIESRRAHGPFVSLEDLAHRVHWFGAGTAAQLSGVLTVRLRERGGSAIVSGDFATDLSAFIAHAAGSPSPSTIAKGLEVLAVFAAHQPHPATQLARKREDLEVSADDIGSWIPAHDLRVLLDAQYHPALVTSLSAAQSEIDVCMFFMAVGGERHPTRPLLEALVRNAEKGCRVRVLLDRDDQGDPYGSRLINEPAARYLSERGVSVRYDRPAQLLHSKFLVIDESLAVVGSHNWTTGSFFEYRDLSLMLRGGEVASAWKARFEELWVLGEAFAPSE